MSEALLQEAEVEGLSTKEVVNLGAEDAGFYGRYFFPNTCRQETPDFHYDMYDKLDSQLNRYVGFMVFRDGAKTTIARIYVSKRIAYGISRTILVVGHNQDHAIYTVDWIKKQVERNTLWSSTFGLEKGKKWSSTHIEIVNKVTGLVTTVLAVGITGSIRGINIDDYRPDFIMVDDPDDEESTGTPEQREKASDRFFGSLMNSLTPASEDPHAKMALLQTTLNDEDLINVCVKDPSWDTFTYSCFTDAGESSWPARNTTETLLEKKQSYISRNQLSLWMREMECKIIARELSAFLPEWLQYYDVPPKGGRVYVTCDPTPPPRQGAEKNRNRKLDDAVGMAVTINEDGVYVLEYETQKSPLVDELVNIIFGLRDKYRHLGFFRWVTVETVLFARVLADSIRKRMAKDRVFFTLREVEDKRVKEDRIKQELSDTASNGRLFVKESMTKFISQFSAYPNVNHDDLLDALAILMTEVSRVNESPTSATEIDDPYEKEVQQALRASGGSFRSCP